MQDTVAIPKDQLNRIENYLKTLSDTLVELLNEVKQRKTDDDIFRQLVESKKFQEEVEETVALYKKDPTQFVDLFELYRKQKAQ